LPPVLLHDLVKGWVRPPEWRSRTTFCSNAKKLSIAALSPAAPKRPMGERFVAMERVPALVEQSEVEGYAVVLADGSRHVDVDPERAYAHAVLAVL